MSGGAWPALIIFTINNFNTINHYCIYMHEGKITLFGLKKKYIYSVKPQINF